MRGRPPAIAMSPNPLFASTTRPAALLPATLIGIGTVILLAAGLIAMIGHGAGPSTPPAPSPSSTAEPFA